MFGTRSAAVRRIDERDARKAGLELRMVRVGRLPASRQGGEVLAFAPDSRVRVGAPVQGCAGPDAVGQLTGGSSMTPQGSLAMPCDGLSQTQPKPLGSGDVTVNANNTSTATLTAVHPFIVIDYGINDPTGVLLVTSILAGTDNLMEGGSIRTNTWQSAKTACPIQKPFTIYPWSGLRFLFSNTTGQNITVNVWALGYVVRC
jgi:hypothetical protein